MEQTLLERKNRQNINKLNSIISEYEAKLDSRVDQVVSEVPISSCRLSTILRSAQILSSSLSSIPGSKLLLLSLPVETPSVIKVIPTI